MIVPQEAFLTKGAGRHREKLQSFEMALRNAGIAHVNLVRVSSIFPPHCKLISKEQGLGITPLARLLFAASLAVVIWKV